MRDRISSDQNTWFLRELLTGLELIIGRNSCVLWLLGQAGFAEVQEDEGLLSALPAVVLTHFSDSSKNPPRLTDGQSAFG